MKLRLRLYVTGLVPQSIHAIQNVLRVCNREFPNEYELIVTDVLEDPAQAELDCIIATPTLVREYPSPRRRVIGDLSEEHQLLIALDAVLYRKSV